MSDKRHAHIGLLRSLLCTLIDEWGYEAVRDHLNDSRPSERSQWGSPTVRQDETKEKRTRAAEKPTASALAAKVSLPSGQKILIEQLAAQYESKAFLPTSGDIRYFFEVHGEEPPPAKQRSESFRKILRVLCALPEPTLRKMIDNEAYSGPSRLAPLSEAMRGVGEQRQSGQVVDTDQSKSAIEDLDVSRRAQPGRPSDA